jgi:tetratricopeptide (TPR) repeat protein/transcriptional regulator with XRE-family HTH domain
MNPFGVTLRQFRLVAGLTQEELAECSGVSVRTISNLENGRIRRPNRRTVLLLAKALHLEDPAANQLVQAARPWPGVPSEAQGAGHAVRTRPAHPGAGRDQVAGEPAIVPRQLPPALAQFAGRAAELDTLDQWLEQASGNGADAAVVISAIGGMPGIGKTALALRWAHRVAGRFPDGQLYVNLRGYDPSGQPAGAAEVVRRFLGALGVAPERIPADCDGQAGLYRSLLAGRRMLIVADNARDAAQVRPLLPGSPGCLVLVTTRGPLAGLAAADGARVLTLDVLTETEAAELLSARLGAARVAAEPQAVAALVELCARLPLALAVVAARAAASGWSLAELAAELVSVKGRLGALAAGDDAADVRCVFSWSCAQLSPAAERLFPLLGVHPGPDISAAAAASLAGLLPPQAQAALRELADVSLVTEHVPGRYMQHDLLRAYAADWAAGPTFDGQAGARRMLDHYLHTAAAAAYALNPVQDLPALGPPQWAVPPERITDGRQAQAWFGAEHKVLLAVTRQAADGGFDDYAQLIPWTLATYLDRGAHWHDLAGSQQIALTCAERLGDLAGQTRAHLHLGQVRLRLGQLGQARTHLTRAAELARQLGDPVAEAHAHLGLGVIQCERELPEALASSLRGLALAEAAGNVSMQTKACNNLGYLYAVFGDVGQGLAYCRQALDLLRQAGNPFLEAHTLDSLGYIYRQLGDRDQAAASYRRAIGLFREIGDRIPAAQSLNHLGDACRAADDDLAARDAWQQALIILDELAHPEAAVIRDKLRSVATADHSATG